MGIGYASGWTVQNQKTAVVGRAQPATTLGRVQAGILYVVKAVLVGLPDLHERIRDEIPVLVTYHTAHVTGLTGGTLGNIVAVHEIR